MSDLSPILSLPLIQPAQAQKHVTHNEALMRLDVLVQLAVADRTRTVAPVGPVAGQRHIVAAGATGVWAGQAGRVALWQDGAWQFHAPLAGWRAWVAAEAAVASYDGAAWKTQADSALQVGQIGVNAAADTTNRLTVSSDATLLNHAGGGHQLKLNKASASDTASLLFQTNWSGRAEMGTAGSDAFSIKVSADGSAFFTGLSIAPASGQVSLPAPLKLGGQAGDPVSPANGEVWLNTASGTIKARAGGVTHVLAPASAPTGDKGDVIVGAGGTPWTVAPSVKYGVQIALNQQCFFN